MAEAATPTRPRPAGIRGKLGRIVGIDVARGLALITMAATHMVATTDADTGRLTTVGWLFAGRASALFAVLAGVSLAIVTGGATPRTGVDRRRARVTIAVRAGVIGLIGLLLAMTETPVAVILAYYAVLFLLALPFLGLGPRVLAGLAVAWALLSPQISFWLRGMLPDPPRGQVDLVMLLTDPATAVQGLLFTGYYPAFTWMTYLLAGLAIGRLDLRSATVASRLAAAGAAIAAAAWGVSALLLTVLDSRIEYEGRGGPISLVHWELNHIEWYGTTPDNSADWLLVAGAHSGTTFDLLHTTGTAMAVIGLCLLLVRADILRRLTYPVAATGAMTLTLYSIHVLVLSFDIGDLGSRTYYLTHVVVALSIAPIWLSFFTKGPFEAVVHEIATGIGRAVVPREPEKPVEAA